MAFDVQKPDGSTLRLASSTMDPEMMKDIQEQLETMMRG